MIGFIYVVGCNPTLLKGFVKNQCDNKCKWNRK